MKRQLLSATALAGVFCAIPPALSAEWNVRVGGYYNAMVAYAQTDLPEVRSDRDFDGVDVSTNTEVFFLPSITLDNGIKIGANIQLEGETDQQGAIDESFVYIKGSFGTLLIGDEDSLPRGSSRTLSNCDPGQKVDYFTPHYESFTLGTGFVSGLSNNRGLMATKSGLQLVTPAFYIDHDLSGYRAYGAGTACVETKLTFPTYLSLGVDYYDLDGSGSVRDLMFSEGLGVTGVGGVPGAFVAAETDVLEGMIDATRSNASATFRVDQPFLIGVTDIIGPPVTFTLSAIGGLKGGVLNQKESVVIYSDTPAFGGDSAWDTLYDTEFDGNYFGGFVGGSLQKEMAINQDLTLTTGLTGTVGFNLYDLDVDDSVDASGLGVLLDYSNRERHNYSVGNPTAGVSGSVGLKTGNINLSAYLGLDWGSNPRLDYARPDSDDGGALAPTLDLKSDLVFEGGISLSVSF